MIKQKHPNSEWTFKVYTRVAWHSGVPEKAWSEVILKVLLDKATIEKAIDMAINRHPGPWWDNIYTKLLAVEGAYYERNGPE